MALINLDSFGVTLGAPLFSNLDLTVHAGDPIGLVAANGLGKSTLLRYLAERLEPSDGTAHYARNLQITLMLQDPSDSHLRLTTEEAVLEVLPAESRAWEAWRAGVALDALRIPPELWDRPLGTLSGGWRRMVLLARAWLTEPDLLLMDEPTNDLDLSRIGFLQRWIAALPKETALLIASHDRAFLDSVTNRTLFLRMTNSVDFALPYSPARSSLDELDASVARRHDIELRQAAQLRRQAAKLHNIGVNSGSDLLTVKTKQLNDRAQRIEAAAQPAYREISAGQIRLSESATSAKFVLTLDHAKVTTPDGRLLFGTGKLWIQPGDRVVLLGRNGTGKSCLLKIVTDAIRGDGCQGVGCAASVSAGICDQSLSHLGPGETLHRAIRDRFDIADQRIRSLLAGAGFAVERQSQMVSQLSGGQRARLAMLILRLEQPNFYILDEPTNHLDIEGQEALEEELTKGGAACLLVSHDRRFVENVGSRFWLIDRGRLVETDTAGEFFEKAMSDA